jgi:hypothetical protein
MVQKFQYRTHTLTIKYNGQTSPSSTSGRVIESPGKAIQFKFERGRPDDRSSTPICTFANRLFTSWWSQNGIIQPPIGEEVEGEMDIEDRGYGPGQLL